ncbi:MAG: hypothetical protein ACPHM3_01585 [Candidatus Kariarchaeum pelagius]
MPSIPSEPMTKLFAALGSVSSNPKKATSNPSVITGTPISSSVSVCSRLVY